MNRRKPRIVIPTVVAELVATGNRVAMAIDGGSSIAEGSPLIGAPLAALVTSIADATSIIPRVNAAYEESQLAVESRNESMSQIRDILIQVRDTYVAISGDRQSPGLCGFEVVQTTSRSGVPRVVIPTNPDAFLDLARRVNDCVVSQSDPALINIVIGLNGLVGDAVQRQSEAIMKRETWQLLVSQRRAVTARITEALRRIRDIGFGIAGPRNYETLSTMGFVVQSNASQSVSPASFENFIDGNDGSNPSGVSPVVGGQSTDSPNVVVADITVPLASLLNDTERDYQIDPVVFRDVNGLDASVTFDQFANALLNSTGANDDAAILFDNALGNEPGTTVFEPSEPTTVLAGDVVSNFQLDGNDSRFDLGEILSGSLGIPEETEVPFEFALEFAGAYNDTREEFADTEPSEDAGPEATVSDAIRAFRAASGN